MEWNALYAHSVDETNRSARGVRCRLRTLLDRGAYAKFSYQNKFQNPEHSIPSNLTKANMNSKVSYLVVPQPNV
jgi:hypothetical protein